MAAKRGKRAVKTPVAPTAEQQALLANILANPDDNKARLVYADLLQDRGDPRGEYIVLQCTRAELPDTDPRVPELDARIASLLAKHKRAWTALGENKGARWVFRRGFVEKLSIDADQLLTNAERIFAAEPIEELSIWKIDESSVTRGKSRLAPLLDLPLHRVRRLSLARCRLVQEDYEALATARTLGSVELLDLTNGGSEEQPLAALEHATSLPKLRELELTGCMIGDTQMAALARANALRFSRLQVQRNELTAKACEAIASATWAPQLEQLDLSSNEQIRDDGVRALDDSTRLTGLRSLVLEYTGLREGAAETLLASPVFAGLELLDLSLNGFKTGISPELAARLHAKFGERLQIKGY